MPLVRPGAYLLPCHDSPDGAPSECVRRDVQHRPWGPARRACGEQGGRPAARRDPTSWLPGPRGAAAPALRNGGARGGDRGDAELRRSRARSSSRPATSSRFPAGDGEPIRLRTAGHPGAISHGVHEGDAGDRRVPGAGDGSGSHAVTVGAADPIRILPSAWRACSIAVTRGGPPGELSRGSSWVHERCSLRRGKAAQRGRLRRPPSSG